MHLFLCCPNGKQKDVTLGTWILSSPCKIHPDLGTSWTSMVQIVKCLVVEMQFTGSLHVLTQMAIWNSPISFYVDTDNKLKYF